MKKYSIGVDLGGTKVLCAIIEKQSNKILFEVKKKTKKEKGNEKITLKLFEALDELFKISNVKKSEISSIGVAAAGQTDRKNGIIINACNLECANLNIKELLEKRYKIKTYLANDVEAAALGELYFGAGRDFKDMVCIFVGTGIGSSIILNRKIYYGSTGTAGEFGHTIIDIKGRKCACGSVGCLETYASRSAIESGINTALQNGEDSVIIDIADTKNISTKHIKQALNAHDKITSQCINEAIEYLSCGIANIINFLNPELIILGGGLIQGIDEIYLKTITNAKAKALSAPAEKIQFKKAELGDYAGIIGASILENQNAV